MARRRTSNFPYLILAFAIASALWGTSHCTSKIDRGVDLPVVFDGVPDTLVITEQSADVVNIRVLGSRAALRDISPTNMEYRVKIDGARPGPAVYEVDNFQIESQLPRGARIVSRSPATIDVVFERRGRRSVRVRPDLEGTPAEGFELGEVEVNPPRVWLVGARSAVLRLAEVVTETIDVTGLTESTEREVRLSLSGGLVWMEENRPVVVKIPVEPLEPTAVPSPEAGEGGESQAGAQVLRRGG